MKEREHQKKAFEFYYALGEGRSYSKVADEFGVSLGTVKLWGKTFEWRRSIMERDAEIARAMADRSMKDGMERGLRNRKIIEMGLVQVAKAIADGRVKMTLSDLDRLIRLEEFLRDEQRGPGETRLIVCWGGGSESDEADCESEPEGE